ncbi:rhomboid family intramembrane serine protease [Microbulbifer sp. CAU 1566]|uniref:rhomboid family intramembrane serine protease n=1 Tax=Microbulbifer sp. CAU 1566 TaxID=2933269 RepID=UPI00200667FA|nr:rhomboid family intramembrane serine protease [Microbulbifer sp. CAU 1566]MCK7596432.1 rhomboid family intramembrane serine protease [Microbulbifer sp. CAU 1566]
MSNWITVCDFPLQQDLSAVADFIRRHQLPLRITEENNHQRVACLAPQLVDPMKQLLERWQSGELDLAQVKVHVYDENETASAGQAQVDEPQNKVLPESVDANAKPGAEPRKKPAVYSVIPDWPLLQTPVSLLLIASCFIGWFLLRQGWFEPLVIFPQQSGDFGPSASSLSRHLAHGEYWRLWTPAIVHFSLPHALFNSLGIWIVGRSLEARAGSLWFALLVLISAPVANLAQYFWAPQNLFGGMSGVVYALIGVAFVIQRWQPQWRDLPSSLVWLAVVWLLVCMSGLVDYFIAGGIANAAHLGGFAAGLILGLLFCIAGGARRYFGSGVGVGVGGEPGNSSSTDARPSANARKRF